jgi:hypothetical protein
MNSIRPCHRCKKHTQQRLEVDGQIRKWICTECNNIAWVGVAPKDTAQQN